MVTIFAGDDIIDYIEITDTNGSLVNIDNLTELYLCFTKKGDTIIAEFNKAGGGDFTALDRLSATRYQYVIDSDITKLLSNDIIKLSVNIAESNAYVTDGIKNTNSAVEVYRVKDAKSKKYS